jgi:hypothetical protein
MIVQSGPAGLLTAVLDCGPQDHEKTYTRRTTYVCADIGNESFVESADRLDRHHRTGSNDHNLI